MKPTVLVSGLIEENGKFLLVKEKIGSWAGIWNFPSGYVESDKTIDEAVLKEVKKRTCLDTEVEGLVGVYQRISKALKSDKNIVRIVFKMKILSGEVCFPDEEIEEAAWLSADEIRKMPDTKIAFGVQETIIDYLERGFMPQKIYSARKMQI
jgi:ADP-ribose pyrophosphatase YjhB (NUDIX family)